MNGTALILTLEAADDFEREAGDRAEVVEGGRFLSCSKKGRNMRD
jgi:hypothetical protein